MIRIRPLVHKDDDSHVFRLFGNLESYTKNEVDQNRSTHGIVNKADEVAPDLQAVQEYIDTMTAPLKFQASDLIWSSYFRINERIANGYRRDRAFLAGGNAFYNVYKQIETNGIHFGFRCSSLPFTCWWPGNESWYTGWQVLYIIIIIIIMIII